VEDPRVIADVSDQLRARIEALIKRLLAERSSVFLG
jgi:hypothetical protein